MLATRMVPQAKLKETRPDFHAGSDFFSCFLKYIRSKTIREWPLNIIPLHICTRAPHGRLVFAGAHASGRAGQHLDKLRCSCSI